MTAFINTTSTVNTDQERTDSLSTQSLSSSEKKQLQSAKSSVDSAENSQLFALMQSASVSNIPSAQFKLGYMYYYGDGVEVDYKKAYSWFEKAAKNEHVEAISWMGYMNMFGYGKEKDYILALLWFQKRQTINDAYSKQSSVNSILTDKE